MTTNDVHSLMKGGEILQRDVFCTPAMRALSLTARGVLVQLMAQCDGTNNGEQMATHEMAKEWGVKSKTTLAMVLRELVDAKLIVQAYSKPGERSRYGINFPPYSDYLKTV
ncbi:hypothetical protein [Pseudomonas brassicacearum]|uniref:MarR family transcriptional regulator n=1 Tax=Pseudomonas brassicacearum TaxID=930166 RepID=A0A423H233_9PSED|nr:hypothetical protein [Pseudomonas brassicacearum]RON06249.1 hypothetical protein BK658_00225 [Pseudomonas brassicacearum]